MRYILVAILMLFFMSTAIAQPANCMPHTKAKTELRVNYGEQPVARGVSRAGAWITEIWANEETGTWTILLLRPGGIACVVDGGEAFEFMGGGTGA